MEKRNIEIGGRIASIWLEEQFWDCLEDLAAQRGVSLRHLVNDIATNHDELPCALRIHVLAHYQTLAGFEGTALTVAGTSCNVSRKYH